MSRSYLSRPGRVAATFTAMLLAALWVPFGTAQADTGSLPDTAPASVKATLQGCNLPDNATTCTDADFTTGNLGKNWAELDLVPHRLILKNNGAAQSFTLVIAADNLYASGDSYYGYDIIRDITDDPNSSCLTGVGDPVLKQQVVGGVYQSLTRKIGVHLAVNQSCTITWNERLAIGAHNYTGSSLQTQLLNWDYTSAGQMSVPLPVKQAPAQQITLSNVTATGTAAYPWTLDVGTPSDQRLSCGATSQTVTYTITYTKGALQAGDYAITGDITLANPANRDLTTNSITVSLTDGTNSWNGTVADPTLTVPANGTASTTFTASIPATAGTLQATATATYNDPDNPGNVLQGLTSSSTPVSVSKSVGTTGATASLSDHEYLATGTNFEFKRTAPTAGAMASFGTDNTYSATVSSGGSTTITKTVQWTAPNNATDTLHNVVTLTPDGQSALPTVTKDVALNASADNPVLTINKNVDAAPAADTTFNFTVSGGGHNYPVSVVVKAGDTSGSDSVSVAPGVTYTVHEVSVSPAGSYLFDVDQSAGPYALCGTPSVTMTDRKPIVGLNIDKIADPTSGSTVHPGDQIIYTLGYYNTGNTDASGTVSDPLPPEVTFVSADHGGTYNSTTNTVSWDPVNVAAKTSSTNYAGTVTVTVTVNTPLDNGTVIENYGLINAVQSNTVHHTVASAPNLHLVKANSPTGTVVPGQNITYTLTYYNDGDMNATNATITDVLPADVDWVSGGSLSAGTVSFTGIDVPAGTSAASPAGSVSFVVKVKSSAGNGDTITNVGKINDTPSNEVSNVVNVPVVPPSNPGIVVLSLAKTAIPVSGSVVQPGQTINYTVTVKNSGNADAPGVTVVDTLPQHLTVNSSTISDNGVLDSNAHTITWALGTVAADTTKAVTFAATVDQDTPKGTDLVNVATLGNQQSSTTHRVATGDLTLVKTVSPTSGAQYGSTLTYGLNAVATGTLNQTGVTVTDVVPTGTTYVAGSAKCLEPATSSECTTSYDAATKTVTWTLGSMAAGAARGLQFQVTIDTPAAQADGSIPATTITNVGNIKSDQTGVLPSNEVKTDVIAVLGEKTVKPPVVTPPPAVEPQKLPFTGAPTSLQLGAGGLLLMLGAGLLMASRRRKA